MTGQEKKSEHKEISALEYITNKRPIDRFVNEIESFTKKNSSARSFMNELDKLKENGEEITKLMFIASYKNDNMAEQELKEMKEFLNKIMDEKKDINQKDKKGFCAIDYAILAKNDMMINFLLKKGASIDPQKILNLTSNAQNTLINSYPNYHWFFKNLGNLAKHEGPNQEKFLSYLKDLTKIINEASKYFPGDLDELTKEDFCNIRDEKQRTPLICASLYKTDPTTNQEETFKKITESMETLILNSNINAVDKLGNSALYYAILGGNYILVDKLLSNAAVIDDNIVKAIESRTKLASIGDNKNLVKQNTEISKSIKNHQAIWLATCIEQEDTQFIKTAIKCGANINDKFNWEILETDAPESKNSPKSDSKITPLSSAVNKKEYDFSLIAELQRLKKRVNGMTPLELAIRNEKYGSVSALIKAGAVMTRELQTSLIEAINRTDSSGNSALYYAIKENNIKAVETLLDNGADINSGNALTANFSNFEMKALLMNEAIKKRDNNAVNIIAPEKAVEESETSSHSSIIDRLRQGHPTPKDSPEPNIKKNIKPIDKPKNTDKPIRHTSTSPSSNFSISSLFQSFFSKQPTGEKTEKIKSKNTAGEEISTEHSINNSPSKKG